jgi:Family of unknown function (DUF6188)
MSIRTGLDDFEAAFSGQSLTRVYFDYAITFITSGGGEFRFANTLTVTAPHGEAINVDPEAPGRAAETVLALLHEPIKHVSLDEAGILELTFASGASVRVGPDDRYEGWTYAGDDGVKIICMPGGGLTTFGANRA